MRRLALIVVLVLTGACDAGPAVPVPSSSVASASPTAGTSSGLTGAQSSPTVPPATRQSGASVATPTGPIVSATAAPAGTLEPPVASAVAVEVGVPLPLIMTPTAAQWVQLDKMDFPRDPGRTTLYDMHSDVLRQLRRNEEGFTFIAPPPPGVQATLAVGKDSTVLVNLETQAVVEALPFPIRLDELLGTRGIWWGHRVRFEVERDSGYGALQLPRGVYELDVVAQTLTLTSRYGDRVLRRYALGGIFGVDTVLPGARWLELTGSDVALVTAAGDSKSLLSGVAEFHMTLDGLHGTFRESPRGDHQMWIDLRTGSTASLGAYNGRVRGPIPSPRGRYLAVTLTDQQVGIWDVAPGTGRLPREVVRYAPSTVYFSGWAEDDSAAIVTFYSGVPGTRSRIEIVDLATGAVAPFAVPEAERWLGSNASLSGTGRFVLDQGIGAAGVRVFDRNTGERISTPQLRASGLAAFSHDERWIFINPIGGHG